MSSGFKKVRAPAMRICREKFQAEGTENTKAMKQVCVWLIRETARRSVWNELGMGE